MEGNVSAILTDSYEA